MALAKILFVKICLDFDKNSEDAGVTVFQGKASLFPVVLHLCQEARASRFPAPFPGLTPGDHQVTNFPAPGLLGAGVDGAADTGYSLEAFHLVMLVVPEQSQKVMVRLQLSRRRCCKHRNPKMGYHLGSQDLACHLSGLPSLHPALQT